jgi:hypothetical protein
VRSRVVTGLVAIGILAGGCGSAGGGGGASPGPSNASTTPAAAALTLAQARAILTNYEKVNNQANSHLSGKLLSSIETGPMLKGDLVDYKITRAGDEPKIKSFTYRSPHFYIPGNAGAGWFAVSATSSNSGGNEFLVFAKTGGTYKLATSVWRGKARFPSIAVNPDGSATAVTGAATAQVATSHSQFLTTTAAGLRGSGFAAGVSTTQLGKTWYKNVAKIKAGGSWLGGTNWKPRTDPVYALKTTDGGALVWYTATQSLDYHTVSPTAWYLPDKTLRALGPDRYHSTFHGTWLWRFAAHVPQGAGPISVVGAGNLAIGASGS